MRITRTVYNYDEFIERNSNKGATRGNMKRDSTMLRLIDAANLHCLLNLRIKIPIFPFFFNAPPPRFSLSRCPTRIRRSMHHFLTRDRSSFIFFFYSYYFFILFLSIFLFLLYYAIYCSWKKVWIKICIYLFKYNDKSFETIFLDLNFPRLASFDIVFRVIPIERKFRF